MVPCSRTVFCGFFAFLLFLPPSFAASVFVAYDPYTVLVNGQPQTVELGGVPITFDFGGAAPFINPNTGVGDFATIQYWDPNQGQQVTLNNWRAATEAPQGVPGRIFKTNDASGTYTALGYKAGDGIVEGTLRTQLNTYPIPSRRRFVWDLVVRFGGADLSQPWTFSPRGIHPATVWQLKSDDTPPALVMAVDTDPRDSSRLALHFDEHTDPGEPASRLGIATGLSPQQDVTVKIDAFLDERLLSQSGQGYVKVWVNGRKIVDASRPTLTAVATTPHHWKIGMYLYEDTSPLPFDRFGFWKRARMLVP
jgi:hypothetical protein